MDDSSWLLKVSFHMIAKIATIAEKLFPYDRYDSLNIFSSNRSDRSDRIENSL